MEIPLLAGRDFNLSNRQNGEKVTIISRDAAKTLWPGENPIGKRIRFADVQPAEWMTVVGVVKDVRHYKIMPPNTVGSIKGDIYFPFTQQPPSAMVLACMPSATWAI